MVLDMVDLLQHETRFDEFIVFSADADFTPVLRKLRRSDRRTTVLAVGFPSAAYQASADLLIDTDTFVRDALGENDDNDHLRLPLRPSTYLSSTAIPLAQPQQETRADQQDVRELATQIIRTEVANSDLAIPLARLASKLPTQVPGLDGASWAGQGSFRRFVEILNLEPLLLDWSHSGGYLYDPRRHACPQPSPDPLGGRNRRPCTARQASGAGFVWRDCRGAATPRLEHPSQSGSRAPAAAAVGKWGWRKPTKRRFGRMVSKPPKCC